MRLECDWNDVGITLDSGRNVVGIKLECDWNDVGIIQEYKNNKNVSKSFKRIIVQENKKARAPLALRKQEKQEAPLAQELAGWLAKTKTNDNDNGKSNGTRQQDPTLPDGPCSQEDLQDLADRETLDDLIDPPHPRAPPDDEEGEFLDDDFPTPDGGTPSGYMSSVDVPEGFDSLNDDANPQEGNQTTMRTISADQACTELVLRIYRLVGYRDAHVRSPGYAASTPGIFCCTIFPG